MSLRQSPIDFELINKYDENGNLVLHVGTDGTRKEYRYDKRSNLIYYNSTKDRIEETKEYDSKDRVIRITSSTGIDTEIQYIENPNDGKLIEVRTKTTDKETNIFHIILQRYEYFLDGSYKISYFSDLNETKTETYDKDGNITLEDSKKFTRIFIYDECKRKVKEINSLGIEECWIYDGDNLMSHYVCRNNRESFRIDYKYDNHGNLIEENNVNGATITYEYDGNDRRTSLHSNTGYFELIDYDEQGRKCKVTTPELYKTYEYDEHNRLVRFCKHKIIKEV